MNLDYLKEPGSSGKSPFDIADDFIRHFRYYREAVKRGLMTREDFALFWGLAKAQDELLRIPIKVGPPVDVHATEDGAIKYLADKMDCEVEELDDRIYSSMTRVGRHLPELNVPNYNRKAGSKNENNQKRSRSNSLSRKREFSKGKDKKEL